MNLDKLRKESDFVLLSQAYGVILLGAIIVIIFSNGEFEDQAVKFMFGVFGIVLANVTVLAIAKVIIRKTDDE